MASRHKICYSMSPNKCKINVKLQGGEAWQNYVPQILEALINGATNFRVLSNQTLHFNITPTGAGKQKFQNLNICLVNTPMLLC
jgi:hypothetical protein